MLVVYTSRLYVIYYSEKAKVGSRGNLNDDEEMRRE
jgi:hypothetical protein